MVSLKICTSTKETTMCMSKNQPSAERHVPALRVTVQVLLCSLNYSQGKHVSLKALMGIASLCWQNTPVYTGSQSESRAALGNMLCWFQYVTIWPKDLGLIYTPPKGKKQQYVTFSPLCNSFKIILMLECVLTGWLDSLTLPLVPSLFLHCVTSGCHLQFRKGWIL